MNILNVLAQITVYSAIIFAVTMLVKKALGSRMSAFLHYAVWLVLVLRLVMPFTIDSPMRFFTIPAESEALQETQDVPGSYDILEDKEAHSVADTTSAAANTSFSQHPVYENTGTAQSAPAQAQEHSRFTWQQAVITIWLAGAGVCIAYIAAVYISLNRKIKKKACAPSMRLKELFEQTKAQMGIKSKLNLVCLYEYGTPALMFPRTVLMPMDALAVMDEEQTKYALRHELTHYKRADHIVSILISLLNAVYWFNPFVWLAFRQMRKDMETACDGQVVKSIGKEQKSSYAALIVRLFAQPEHRQIVLGLAQADVRKTAEHRVRGIFMKEKSKKSVKLICVVLAATLLFTCFTTACQPTPEESAVVGKGEFEDIIAQEQTENQEDKTPVIAEPYEAPDSWTESIDMKGSDIEVNVDADIIVPDVSAYPVYEVVKNNFTQQQIDDLMDYFVQDKDIMQAPGMTKADYQEMLIEAKRGQMIDGEYVVNENSLAWVKEVEEMIHNAPETSEPQVVTNRSIEGDGFGGAVVMEDGKYGSVSATERMFDFCSAGYPVPESQKLDMYGTGIEGEMNISEQEAVEKAQELFRELGIENMKAVYIEKAELISRSGLKIDVETPKLESRGYYIKFALSIDGIDTVLIEGGSSHKGETFDYSAPWTPEWIRVYIDENGEVGYFNWRGPLKLTKKVSENVALKSFEDIKDRIRAQMLYECGFSDGNPNEIKITVERIEMKMTIVGVKDDPDKAMYVPAWYVYYVETHNVDFTNDNGEHVTEMSNEELIVLNAIDGGVVLPFKGPSDLSNAEDVALAEDEISESIE